MDRGDQDLYIDTKYSIIYGGCNNPLGKICYKKLLGHPIRVAEQGNYHVIVLIEYPGVQHPMISMLFIPYRKSEHLL